jgi:hypothetical protein
MHAQHVSEFARLRRVSSGERQARGPVALTGKPSPRHDDTADHCANGQYRDERKFRTRQIDSSPPRQIVEQFEANALKHQRDTDNQKRLADGLVVSIEQPSGRAATDSSGRSR